MNKTKTSNEFSALFIVFFVLAIILVLSPVLVYIPIIRSFISLLLKELFGYKGIYLEVLGATIGTGLAVSSALWLQKKEVIKREDDVLKEEKQKLKQAAQLVENWIRREINMLWGMWIWSTFDVSVYIDGEAELPFEPYCIETTNVFTNFSVIGHIVSKEARETFYDLYFFAEKANQYIENYNRMNYDIIDLRGDTSYNNFNLSSGVQSNSSSKRYKQILSYIMSQKRQFLFFDDDKDIMSLKEFLIKRSTLYQEKSILVDQLIKSYSKENNVDHWNSQLTINRIVENKLELPEYKEQLSIIRNIEKLLETLNFNFESTKSTYFSDIDNPSLNATIRHLLEGLGKI